MDALNYADVVCIKYHWNNRDGSFGDRKFDAIDELLKFITNEPDKDRAVFAMRGTFVVIKKDGEIFQTNFTQLLKTYLDNK